MLLLFMFIICKDLPEGRGLQPDYARIDPGGSYL